MDKREIRQRVLKIRDAMSDGERMRSSLLLTERILGHQWFYRAENLLCFVNYGSEISTEEIILEALHKGKKVFVPKVVDADMKFYRIRSMEELIVGYKGIREPKGDSEEYVYSDENAEKNLLLMPGVAFDQYRNRIGYGKGFYDRYLSDKEALQLHSIAVGFQCQLVEEIPTEENDIKPYQVICV